MTERLELTDAELRTWEAEVVATAERGVVLDRCALYPGGGGQPPDWGSLAWDDGEVAVEAAVHDGEVVISGAEGATLPSVGAKVTGAVDDERRSALMRTHSALHVLSQVMFRDFGTHVTGSAMEPLLGRMDFNLPGVPEGFRTSVEEACNAAIREDHPVKVRFVSPDEAAGMPELIRHEESRVPAGVDRVRIVDIVGFDTQADGGTHVASTALIGAVRVVKVENKGKGFRRIRLGVLDAAQTA